MNLDQQPPELAANANVDAKLIQEVTQNQNQLILVSFQASRTTERVCDQTEFKQRQNQRRLLPLASALVQLLTL